MSYIKIWLIFMLELCRCPHLTVLVSFIQCKSKKNKNNFCHVKLVDVESFFFKAKM